MTSISTLEDINDLKEDYWVLLVKNLLFWKAKLTTVQVDEMVDGAPMKVDKVHLSIGYGKNKANSLNSEPSQVIEYENREKAVANLTKLFKDKIKNGYEASSFEICCGMETKENEKPISNKTQQGVKIEEKIKAPILLSNIEHKCLQIPQVLTLNQTDSEEEVEREERIQRAPLKKEASDSSEEANQTMNRMENYGLGKRDIGSHLQKDAYLEETISQENRKQAISVSLDDVPDKNSVNQSSSQLSRPTNTRMGLNRNIESTYRVNEIANRSIYSESKKNDGSKDGSVTILNGETWRKMHNPATLNESSSKSDSVARLSGGVISHRLKYINEQELTELKNNLKLNLFTSIRELDEIADEWNDTLCEEESESRSFVLTRKIIGCHLYEVENNSKIFNENLTIQTKDSFLYIEYEVSEDSTLNKKELHEFIHPLQSSKCCDFLLKNAINNRFLLEIDNSQPNLSLGTINTLKHRSGIYKDHKNKSNLQSSNFVPHVILELSPSNKSEENSKSDQKSFNEVGQQGSKPRGEENSMNKVHNNKNDSVVQSNNKSSHGVEENSKGQNGGEGANRNSNNYETQREQDPEEEETIQVGENMRYEALSHSNPDVEYIQMHSLVYTPQYENDLEKRSKEKEKNEAAIRSSGKGFENANVHPLGSVTESIIPLQLLHNYKSDLKISCKWF